MVDPAPHKVGGSVALAGLQGDEIQLQDSRVHFSVLARCTAAAIGDGVFFGKPLHRPGATSTD
ncbi:hypothetical protein GQ55_6G202400 [Panicum hallii var. hallii]|uniref:Uncharacterized protein n=1 Tax=Panicum hallii var. hallii TaxID=1504633 RepID=A0A2T7D7Q8_9POAL|nr:hypothetical protein GQ55_6G202400 [Panicum hallii var. hallii]